MDSESTGISAARRDTAGAKDRFSVVRWFIAMLLGIGAGCAGPLPVGQQPVKHSGALAEDLDCSVYQVDDGTPEGHSSHLGCTGLYANFSQRTLSDAARAFTPGYVLWSDNADKSRWIYLPAGTQIDTGGVGPGTMDSWIFPVGTKAWKQFSFGDRLVETRLLWKRADGWFRATYLWSDDLSSALEYTGDVGLPVLGSDPDGPQYEVPPASACSQCHDGSADTLLGFEAISLAAQESTGLSLDELVRQELLTLNPDRAYTVPGDPDAEASLSWLHSNCGTACHNEARQPSPSELRLRLTTNDLNSVQDTAVWRTAVGRFSLYRPSPRCGDLPWKRVNPGVPDCSTILYRISVRDPYPGPYLNQMPPLLSHRVPLEVLDTLQRWVASIPPQ